LNTKATFFKILLKKTL